MISKEMFGLAIDTAVRAGKAIMKVYSKDVEVGYKEDHSPLTIADQVSHNIIVDALSSTGIPVLSEEGIEIPYSERKIWKEFWLIDPLDGTKEFIKRNGDFTVNIAFIEGQEAVSGIIYAPARRLLYYAYPGIGAFRIEQDYNHWKGLVSLDELITTSVRLPEIPDRKGFVVVASKSHRNAETEEYLFRLESSYEDIEFIEVGSSLKFCKLAEGSAHLYPRLGPTMEWDTAAGQAIAEISGCQVSDFTSETRITYNKESLLNPHFIVQRFEG